MDDEIRSLLAQGRLERGFELLLSAYRDRVMRLAYSIVWSEPLADEVAQQTFIRIWKGLPSYRGDASLSTWIYTITRNTALTVRKRSAAAAAPSLDHQPTRRALEKRSASGHLPDHTPDVGRLIANLPECYRRVIVLYYMEERSYAEVADMLDLPLGTVKTNLHRARKELAKAMAGFVRCLI